MEKTITTGTKITFTETGDKFELIKTDTGFDVKAVKLSKNNPTEHYTFQELFDLYASTMITIHGFEAMDAPLVKSIFTAYIHEKEISDLKADITRITGEKEAMEAANQQLTTANGELTTEISQFKTTNQELTDANEKLITEKNQLFDENKTLIAKNEKLNIALEAMQEQE